MSAWRRPPDSHSPSSDEDHRGGPLDQDLRQTLPEALFLQRWDPHRDLPHRVAHVLDLRGKFSLIRYVISETSLRVLVPALASGLALVEALLPLFILPFRVFIPFSPTFILKISWFPSLLCICSAFISLLLKCLSIVPPFILLQFSVHSSSSFF